MQLQLFSTMVDSVLPYGAELWGVQQAARAATGHEAPAVQQALHLGYLRRLLGVQQGTPSAVVLAECCERPLSL